MQSKHCLFPPSETISRKIFRFLSSCFFRTTAILSNCRQTTHFALYDNIFFFLVKDLYFLCFGFFSSWLFFSLSALLSFFCSKKNLFHVANTITFYSKMNVNFDFFLFLRKTISRNFILYFLGQSHHNKTLLLFTFNGWCSKCKTPKQRTKQLWMYLFFFGFVQH